VIREQGCLNHRCVIPIEPYLMTRSEETFFWRCQQCGTQRPRDQFYVNGREMPWCLLCRRQWAANKRAAQDPAGALLDAQRRWKTVDNLTEQRRIVKRGWRRGQSASNAGRQQGTRH
jgi:hypothetical protein